MPHDEQQASRSAHRRITRVLAVLPTRYRISHLIASLLFEDKAAPSVELMLEIAMMMARRLPVHQQTRIIWLLEEARSELRARWH
jgi:hypothetical protein